MSDTATNKGQLLDHHDLHRIYGISPRSWRRYALDGTGPRHLRINSRVIRYRIEDVEAWLNSKVRA